jgi:two-component sensor histidine kinase
VIVVALRELHHAKGHDPGFGLRLLEQILPADLNARSKLRFAPSGLVCRVDLPMSSQVLRTD